MAAKQNKKEKIPATLRNTIWNTYIGTENKTGICFCCQTEMISTANFECGHVLAEKNNGELTIDNLRPICSLCNKSMGTQNMEMFMTKHGYTKCKDWNGIIKNNDKNDGANEETLNDLTIKELKIIATQNNIKESIKQKIIDELLTKKFNYDEWYDKQLEKYTNDKLNILCRILGLSGKRNKPKTIDVLRFGNIQINIIEDLVNKISMKKYLIECSGDFNRTCTQCEKSSDGAIIQCKKCDNSHLSFIDTDISKTNKNFGIFSNYFIFENMFCDTCKVSTIQSLYNNPFYNFIDKEDKLLFKNIKCEDVKEINTDNIINIMERLEKEMKEVKSFIKEMRTDINNIKISLSNK